MRLLATVAIVLALSGCGPSLRNVTVTVNLPPTEVVTDAEEKVVPIQVNIGNKTVAIDTARGATVPLSALGL